MNPTDRSEQTIVSSNGQQYQHSTSDQLNTKQKPQLYAGSGNNGAPTEAEASKMLEAALLQMDGIIMGELAIIYASIYRERW